MRESLALDCRPVAGLIGAEIAGLDLREPLSVELAAAVREAASVYGVVFFRQQKLSTSQHVAFGSALGKLRVDVKVREKAEGVPEVGVLSSANGNLKNAAQWHTDSAGAINPPTFVIIQAEVRPPYGGDTIWTSQAAAFERLSPDVQDLLEGLSAFHEVPRDRDPRVEYQSAIHPLVCVHPVTGRKSLFVNRLYTQRILELSECESRYLLGMLFEHSVRPEFTCRWRWNDGDVAVWNNPYVQHFAIQDYGDAPRKMHRVEVEGVPLVPARPIDVLS